jgi:Arc/MetJ family transcription regulator
MKYRITRRRNSTRHGTSASTSPPLYRSAISRARSTPRTGVLIDAAATKQGSKSARLSIYALLLLEPLVVGLGPNVYNIMHRYTRHGMWPMRTNIEIDDVLMREAQKASGHATKKQTVEEALRLMIRLRRQHEVDAAFGRYRWRGNLASSRTGRGAR